MSKELTEQWRKGKLEAGWYFLEFENGSILPVNYCGFNREFEFRWDWKISKVLSPASYNHFVELTEKVNQFSQLVKRLSSWKSNWKKQKKLYVFTLKTRRMQFINR